MKGEQTKKTNIIHETTNRPNGILWFAVDHNLMMMSNEYIFIINILSCNCGNICADFACRPIYDLRTSFILEKDRPNMNEGWWCWRRMFLKRLNQKSHAFTNFNHKFEDEKSHFIWINRLNNCYDKGIKPFNKNNKKKIKTLFGTLSTEKHPSHQQFALVVLLFVLTGCRCSFRRILHFHSPFLFSLIQSADSSSTDECLMSTYSISVNSNINWTFYMVDG